MKRSRTYLPTTVEALSAMGAQVAIARRELGWTVAELAQRLGVTAPTVTRIERGDPGTAVGTVFEAATVCGVPLFGVEPSDLRTVASRERDRLAVLPTRIRRRRTSGPESDDDF